MGRSRKHRKQFPCGHRGYGQVCRRCTQEKAQVEREAAEEADRRRERQRWEDSFKEDPINLRGLPKQIVEKARHIILELERGTPYSQLGGVKFKHSRKKIRIPVTLRYRMLCHDIDGKIVPKAVISHESYNSIAKNTKK